MLDFVNENSNFPLTAYQNKIPSTSIVLAQNRNKNVWVMTLATHSRSKQWIYILTKPYITGRKMAWRITLWWSQKTRSRVFSKLKKEKSFSKCLIETNCKWNFAGAQHQKWRNTIIDGDYTKLRYRHSVETVTTYSTISAHIGRIYYLWNEEFRMCWQCSWSRFPLVKLI